MYDYFRKKNSYNVCFHTKDKYLSQIETEHILNTIKNGGKLEKKYTDKLTAMGSNIENTKGWFWDWKKKIDSMIGSNNPYQLFMTNSEDTNGSAFLREFFTNM